MSAVVTNTATEVARTVPRVGSGSIKSHAGRLRVEVGVILEQYAVICSLDLANLGKKLATKKRKVQRGVITVPTLIKSADRTI